jgi:hypothetical protein
LTEVVLRSDLASLSSSAFFTASDKSRRRSIRKVVSRQIAHEFQPFP